MNRPLAAAALLALAACGGDATPATTTGVASSSSTGAVTTTTPAVTTTAPALPPHLFADLVPLLQPLVDPLGFTVTRAALVNLATYETSPEGTHLAVYVVPTAAHTPDEVAALIVPLVTAFLPEVYTRWPGLTSFDVCQEPYGWDGSGTAPSDTIVTITREQAEAIEWTNLTLDDLVAAVTDLGIGLFATAEVRTSATWAAAGGF